MGGVGRLTACDWAPVRQLVEADLEELFSKFGRLEKCEVIVDPATRESRYVLSTDTPREKVGRDADLM